MSLINEHHEFSLHSFCYLQQNKYKTALKRTLACEFQSNFGPAAMWEVSFRLIAGPGTTVLWL